MTSKEGEEADLTNYPAFSPEALERENKGLMSAWNFLELRACALNA